MSGALDFLGPAFGGLLGGLITGGAQLWSFRKGKQVARAERGYRAAADLLEDVYFCTRELRKLTATQVPPGSPLSYAVSAAMRF